jgi:hypothetical protein
VWPGKGDQREPKAAYFIRYADQHGRERKFKIGSPSSMTLKEARKAVTTALGAIDTAAIRFRKKGPRRGDGSHGRRQLPREPSVERENRGDTSI